MEWTKITVETTADNADVVSAVLFDMGVQGVEIINPQEARAHFAETSQHWDYIDEGLLGSGSSVAIIFYLGQDDESTEFLHKIKAELEALCIQGITTETVDDSNWLHEWKKHFKPIRLGRVLVVPEWEQADANTDDVVFTIDPGSAFGTGQHATTALCIEALQTYLHTESTVLDIGCGSGILSIISLLLGAADVKACDIDPSAVEVTRKNAALNRVPEFEVYAGDILSDINLQNKLQGKYDIVMANIVADVIISLAPAIPALLSAEGKFIASGIIDERLDDVCSALKACNLSVIESIAREGWNCLVVENG